MLYNKMKLKKLFSQRALHQVALLFLLAVAPTTAMAQGMTDDQVVELITNEMKAGRTQSQIVATLIQRGVRVDQIRRIRQQYGSQLSKRGLSGAADAAVASASSRMRTEQPEQELNDGMVAPSGDIPKNVTQVEDIMSSELNSLQGSGAVDERIKVFGRDIFNKKALSFEPNMNMPTPQDYVLGPGDKVVVDIYGGSQKSLQLTITPDGDIVIPGYGPMAMAGLTVAQAQARLRSKLGARYTSSEIKMTLGQIRTIMVNVMGEVKAPGTYRLSAFASVFHALYMAGGINGLGTLRNIRVIRGGKTVTIVDIYEYILKGRLAGDIRLNEGDVIQVDTYDCLVEVSGNVKRPMFYEMRKTETVATVLEFAGGLTGDAYKKSVRLLRKAGERNSVYTIGEFEQASFKLEDGDHITAEANIDRYENMVEVKGAVFRPGMFHLGDGISSVRSLIEHADGLTEDAFTARAVLHRMKEDRSLEVISVNLDGIMAGTVPDMPLHNEDVLFVPTVTDLRKSRTLTIQGHVFSPGIYEYADNTTLEDLILQAGGLTDAASTARVDVSRRIIDPKATTSSSTISETYSFSLKDGFVVDGEQGFILKPYDIVQVRRSPGFYTPRQVTVEGEVNFEGRFTLEKKNMRLSDLINLAGGLTADAFPYGARLYRKMNDDDRARVKDVISSAKQSQSERDSVDISRLELDNTYIVGIELDKALAEPGGSRDIIIREGDRLVIPEYNGTVRISGNVMSSNTVPYTPGKNYKWYINQAGGFAERSKKSKTYVVYQNGMIAQVKKGAKIEPGCEIIVPAKPKKEVLTTQGWLSVATSSASIVSVLATLIYIISK